MSIRPSSGINLTWYSKSETLDNKVATNFPELVRRIQLFNRDSLMLMISGCAWYAWSSPDDARLNTDLNYILTRYSPFIGTLALIYCKAEGGKPADEVDLRILVGELFNIGGFEPEAEWFIQYEITPLQNRLKELSKENQYLKKIGTTEIKNLSSLLTMTRATLIQWEGRSFSTNDWLRSYVLYENLKEVALEKGYCDDVEFDKAERQFIGTTVDRLMRSVMLLIALFHSSIPNKYSPPGSFDPKRPAIPKELQEKIDMTDGDLEVVVDRFALNVSSARELKNTLEKLPPKAWLCSPELWVLYDHPLLRIDDKEPYRLVMSVLPDGLHPKCARYLLNEIVKFYEVNKLFKAKDRAYELRGIALESLISGLTDDPSFQKTDSLLPEDYTGKRPDFLWTGTDWTIMFEIKANIKMNSDQTFFNSASLVDTWNILTEPLDQARAVIETGIIKTKRKCLVIVTNDNLVEPLTNFKRIAKQWKFLAGTGIDCLGLLSLSQLETALIHHSPDKVGENLQKTWNLLDPLSVHAQLLDYDFFDAHKFQTEPPKYLADKWKELFPHLDVPKN